MKLTLLSANKLIWAKKPNKRAYANQKTLYILSHYGWERKRGKKDNAAFAVRFLFLE